MRGTIAARQGKRCKQSRGRPTEPDGYQEVGFELRSISCGRKCVRSNTEHREACVVDVGFAALQTYSVNKAREAAEYVSDCFGCNSSPHTTPKIR